MVDAYPQQERVWNAYGQAMGAVTGLELVLRIANMTTRFHAIEASQISAGNKHAQRTKLLANAGAGTFGQISGQFCELYPQVADLDPLFRDAIKTAVAIRNHLTHGFLAGRVRLLRSDRGLDLMELECVHAMEHFRRIEQYVGSHSEIDFSVFAAQGDEELLFPSHPLAHLLKSHPAVVSECEPSKE